MSSANTRLLRNVGLRVGPEVLTRLAGLVLLIALARTLGPRELGEYAFAIGIAQVLWSVAGMGIDRLAMREVARDSAAVATLVWDMSALKVTAALAGMAIAFGAVWLGGMSDRIQLLVVLAGTRVAVSLITLSVFSVIQGLERMTLYWRLLIPIRFAVIAAQLVALALGGRAVAVVSAELLAELVAAPCALLALRRSVGLSRPRLAPRRWRSLLRSTAPFGLQETLGQLVFRIDAILLGILATSAAVGVYSAGYRLLEAILFVVYAVAAGALPMFATLKRDGTPSLGHAYSLALRAGLILTMPVAVATSVCAEPLVDLLFGLPEYDDTVTVLPWLGFAAVAIAVGYTAGTLVVVRRPGRIAVVLTASALAFNVALNAVLIPVLDAQGAAVATLATELAVAFGGLWLARSVAGIPRVTTLFQAAVLGGIAMAAVAAPLADRVGLAIGGGLVVYVAVVVLVERRELGETLALARAALARTRPVR